LRIFLALPINRLEPPGEACRGGSYAFEKQAETAKSTLRRTGDLTAIESAQAAKLDHFGSQEP
jgi:hypothetical protein